MMGRGGDSAGKRRIKAQRLEKKAAKAERRNDRAAAGEEDEEEVDEAALMQQFSQISEQHAAGALKTEEFEVQRHEIFVALGLEPADD
jgi:hypothetical protein